MVLWVVAYRVNRRGRVPERQVWMMAGAWSLPPQDLKLPSVISWRSEPPSLARPSMAYTRMPDRTSESRTGMKASDGRGCTDSNLSGVLVHRRDTIA